MNSEDSPPSDSDKPPSADFSFGASPEELLRLGLQSRVTPASSRYWEPPTPETLSELLPKYQITALLGRGGMGAVYKGVQTTLERPVAIKLLPAEMASDPSFITRFQREARMLAKLQHPGIVAVYDFGQTSEGYLYFIMEYVDGTDLSHIIRGPGLSPAQALEIVVQICDALQYAHNNGVMHRDIKPANVLLNKDGRAKLADFGLARPITLESSILTKHDVVMGTPDYMAPEQLYGTPDHRADLFSLGVMFYEMLTGRPPRGSWLSPSQRVQVDVRLDKVVVRALQEDPELRYQQASEIKTDVDHIRHTPYKEQAPPKQSFLSEPVIEKKSAKSPLPLFTMICAVIVVSIGIFLLWRQLRPTLTPHAAERVELVVENTASEPTPKFEPPVKMVTGPTPQSTNFTTPSSDKTETPLKSSQTLNVKGASLSVITDDKVNVLPLKVGQPRLYDSSPLRTIDGLSPTLVDWNFLSIPQRMINNYEVTVLRSGTVYAFGYRRREATKESILGLDADKWKDATGDITGVSLLICYKRDFTEGEKISMQSFELQLAAEHIVIERSVEAPAPIASQQPDSTDKLRYVDARSLSTSGLVNVQSDIRSFGDSKYLLVKGNRTWDEAQSLAKEKGGHLAVITSKEENTWIQKELLASQSCRAWIGGRLNVSRQWEWVTGEPWNYASWKSGSPSGGSKDKLEIGNHSGEGTWNDVSNDEIADNRFFIIEWSKNNDSDPRLARLKTGFDTHFENKAENPFQTALARLNENYLSAISRARDEARRQLNTTEVVAIDNERLFVEKNKNIPLRDAAETPQSLKDLRKTYRQSRLQIESDRNKASAPLYDIYLKELDLYYTELEQSNKDKEAEEIKNLRLQLARQKPTLSSNPPAKSSEINLFDGKSLAGWKETGGSNTFGVLNGIIKNNGRRTKLVYVGNGREITLWQNFELLLKVRTSSGSNAGIWIHHPNRIDAPLKTTIQIQIANESNNDPNKTGSILGIERLTKTTTQDNAWFEMRILVQGNTIEVFIDGKRVNHWRQPNNWTTPSQYPTARLGQGTIALETYAGIVSFKDIRLTPLP